MEKRCYVCGKLIGDKDFYYNIGPNSYVCGEVKCYNFYYWDNLATLMIQNLCHEYAIIDKTVYQIGDDKDEPQGFGGKDWIIDFNDGTCIKTHSLWYIGKLPERLQHDFPDNAKFVRQ